MKNNNSEIILHLRHLFLEKIDHISNPKDDYHKCNLLDQEIPAITYNSGGTYTLGALLQAIDVFQVFFSV